LEDDAAGQGPRLAGRARLAFWEKVTDDQGGITEAIIWEVPRSTAYPEGLKYRLAYIPPGRNEPAVLYDVHPGKGHHRHIKGIEFPYEFLDVRQLRVDFEADVERVMKGDRR